MNTGPKVLVTVAGLALLCITVPSRAGDFSGPVFGLATAPNGDLLAADAAVGVIRVGRKGISAEAAFILANDVGPIGGGAWWVVTGGIDGQQNTDVGQGVFRASRGSVRKLANLFEFEVANDPVPPPPGGGPESNPFDLAVLDGEHALVVDAAGNDLLLVDDEGNVDVVAMFPYELVSTADLKNLLGCPVPGVGLCFLPPSLPAQPVPTSVAIGPDGAYYVGELKGFPAPRNESRIWRVAAGSSWVQCGTDPGCELLFDGGFTSIIDLAFGPDGRLYVVELDEHSWFATTLPGAPLAGGTISACDLNALSCSSVASGVSLPTAISFGKDGTLWAVENGPVPGAARLVEIP